jgi:glucans biosynthesis protein
LLQRERNFVRYEDIFNHYHQAPSVWVQPRGNWGEGDVHLVELRTDYEGLDNVVAFWAPAATPRPMEPYRIAYTLYWTLERDMKFSQNQVVATRVGADPRDPGKRKFVIDFNGPELAAIAENAPPTAIVNCSDNALIVENQPFYNPFDRSWRVILKLQPKPDNKNPVDMRCTLMKGDEVVSETWTYLWSPP